MVFYDLNKIYKELALKHGLDERVIEHIVRSQFSFLKEVMNQGEYKCLLLPKFGKFYVKPKRVEHIKRVRESKKDGNQ
jgi:nucleoid DNA-binding protein